MATNEANTGGPYRVPRHDSGWRAFGLALAVHALLVLFLVIGINWQNTQPVAVEAEVWDLTTQQAAPPPPPAEEPEPEPAPAPEPKPEPMPPPPAPTPAPPPPKEVTPPKPDPEIALKKEREKKKKEEERRLAEEKAEDQRKQKLADEKQERKLAEQKQKELEKKEREKEEKERLAEEKAAAEKKELAEKKKKDDEAKKKQLAEKKAAEKKASDSVAKARADEMRRITGAAGGSSGTAEKSTAPRMDGGYVAAITAKIKSNISYAGSQDVSGNPRAEFKISQLPTGEIISVRKIKSSGIPAYDAAVENAINKSSPLPKKKDGTVERDINANFNLKDLP
jgi:colicin import membrane protein